MCTVQVKFIIEPSDRELQASLRSNLDSALACAVCLLSSGATATVFDEMHLYKTIASLSYQGLWCAACDIKHTHLSTQVTCE
jgi:hypothetical protein